MWFCAIARSGPFSLCVCFWGCCITCAVGLTLLFAVIWVIRWFLDCVGNAVYSYFKFVVLLFCLACGLCFGRVWLLAALFVVLMMFYFVVV